MIEPIKHNPNLDGYEGQWVATNDDGVVVASAESSVELARMILAGEVRRDVLIEYVPRPTEHWQSWASTSYL